MHLLLALEGAEAEDDKRDEHGEETDHILKAAGVHTIGGARDKTEGERMNDNTSFWEVRRAGAPERRHVCAGGYQRWPLAHGRMRGYR